MDKTRYPITSAIRFLRKHKADFIPYLYDYIEHGGTHHSSLCLNQDEHKVIKTIILSDQNKKGLIVLMHGDKHISTRNLARQLNQKHIEPATPEQANKWTGYLVGGTSPFGTKTNLAVFVEESIFDLDRIFINGGKKGFLIEIPPSHLMLLKPSKVHVAVEPNT